MISTPAVGARPRAYPRIDVHGSPAQTAGDDGRGLRCSSASRLGRPRRVGKTQDALGDDVVLHFVGAAGDGARLAAQPATDGGQFVGVEGFAVPTEALISHQFHGELGAIYAHFGADVLQDRGDGGGTAVGAVLG